VLQKLKTKIYKWQEVQGCRGFKVGPANSGSDLANSHICLFQAKTITPTDEPEQTLQPAVEEWNSSQPKEGDSEGEVGVEEPCYSSDDGLEIVEQVALDYFNSILQNAQKLAAEAEKQKPRKRPRRYNGKSKRTMKRQENH
jgi:hypothetical protein